MSRSPPPVQGGGATAAALATLRRQPTALGQADAQALSAAAAARQRPGGLGPLPASTSLLTLDRNGNAVACAFTMNNLFGTGRVAPGTGIVLVSRML